MPPGTWNQGYQVTRAAASPGRSWRLLAAPGNPGGGAYQERTRREPGERLTLHKYDVSSGGAVLGGQAVAAGTARAHHAAAAFNG